MRTYETLDGKTYQWYTPHLMWAERYEGNNFFPNDDKDDRYYYNIDDDTYHFWNGIPHPDPLSYPEVNTNAVILWDAFDTFNVSNISSYTFANQQSGARKFVNQITFNKPGIKVILSPKIFGEIKSIRQPNFNLPAEMNVSGNEIGFKPVVKDITFNGVEYNVYEFSRGQGHSANSPLTLEFSYRD